MVQENFQRELEKLNLKWFTNFGQQSPQHTSEDFTKLVVETSHTNPPNRIELSNLNASGTQDSGISIKPARLTASHSSLSPLKRELPNSLMSSTGPQDNLKAFGQSPIDLLQDKVMELLMETMKSNSNGVNNNSHADVLLKVQQELHNAKLKSSDHTKENNEPKVTIAFDRIDNSSVPAGGASLFKPNFNHTKTPSKSEYIKRLNTGVIVREDVLEDSRVVKSKDQVHSPIVKSQDQVHSPQFNADSPNYRHNKADLNTVTEAKREEVVLQDQGNTEINRKVVFSEHRNIGSNNLKNSHSSPNKSSDGVTANYPFSLRTDEVKYEKSSNNNTISPAIANEKEQTQGDRNKNDDDKSVLEVLDDLYSMDIGIGSGSKRSNTHNRYDENRRQKNERENSRNSEEIVSPNSISDEDMKMKEIMRLVNAGNTPEIKKKGKRHRVDHNKEDVKFSLPRAIEYGDSNKVNDDGDKGKVLVGVIAGKKGGDQVVHLPVGNGNNRKSNRSSKMSGLHNRPSIGKLPVSIAGVNNGYEVKYQLPKI